MVGCDPVRRLVKRNKLVRTTRDVVVGDGGGGGGGAGMVSSQSESLNGWRFTIVNTIASLMSRKTNHPQSSLVLGFG